jgi:RecJ-like exonuclease
VIRVVHCFSCGNDGPMPASIKYDYRVDTCGMCHHQDAKTYAYHFCSLKCMVEYVDKFRDGLPCQSCHSTGFALGFKENGPCAQCTGRGRVPMEIATALAGLRAPETERE